MTPNRVAVYLTVVAAVAGGVAPVVANMDLSSTAGIITAVLAIAAVVRKWLDGWQKYEARLSAGLEPGPAAGQTVA